MLRAQESLGIASSINTDLYTLHKMSSEIEELKQAVAQLQKQVGRLSGTSSVSGRGRM
jgi:uncharacterized protein YoxC